MFADRAKVGPSRFFLVVLFSQIINLGYAESFRCTSLPSRNRKLPPRPSREAHQRRHRRRRFRQRPNLGRKSSKSVDRAEPCGEETWCGCGDEGIGVVASEEFE